MESLVPKKLNGKEFEQALIDAAARCEKQSLIVMDRYGVEVSNFGGKITPIPSKPDFEGTRADGRHFIIEAKTCSQSNFAIEKRTIKPRQVKHMLKRSRFGSKCFILIHFNQRILKNAVQPAFTVAIPVNDDDPRWQRYVDAYADAKREKQPIEPQGSICRNEAQDMGRLVMWKIPERCRTATPDLMPILYPEFFQIQLPTVQPVQTTLFNEE